MLNKRHSNGFTLIELIVTLVIATLLTTAAFPGFSGLVKKNRISIYAHNLVTSLALARSEAVKRGTQVSLCASNNGINCTHTSFQQGWIVFTDQSITGTVDGTDTILRVQKAMARLSFTITGHALVQYLPSGVLVANVAVKDSEWLTEQTPAPLYPDGLLNQLFTSLLPGTAAHASGLDDSPGLEEAPFDPLRTGISNFDICTTDTSGEPGTLIVVSITGRISTQNITCN